MCRVRRLDEYNRQNPNSMDARTPLPSYPRSAFSPTSMEDGVGFQHLVGTTIRFPDDRTGEITDCTIQDCGTSHLRGDWIEVVYDDGRELRISPEEMLARKVG